MHDDKRMLRELKRSIKQAGNRKRRRFLKDVSIDHDQFDYGDDSSAFMNEPRPARFDEDADEKTHGND
jgi:hypothetical protein